MNKKEILEQLQAGKLTTEEAMRLLNEAEGSVKKDPLPVEIVNPKGKSKNKFIVIKVHSPEKKEKVNIRLPLGVVELGLKLGGQFDQSGTLKGVNPQDIQKLLDDETIDRIVDVQGENGETVEIYVER